MIPTIVQQIEAAARYQQAEAQRIADKHIPKRAGPRRGGLRDRVRRWFAAQPCGTRYTTADVKPHFPDDLPSSVSHAIHRLSELGELRSAGSQRRKVYWRVQ